MIATNSDVNQFEVDLQKLISTRLLIQANSGGGKSYCLRYLLEQTHGKVQQIVFDPEGEFASLREHFDYILVGKEGDLPIEVKAAKLMCRRFVELGASAIIDLYELSLQDRKRFVKLFLDELMHLPKALWRPLMVVIDEAHVFCPERGAGEAESTEAVKALCTQGRKRGFCPILATQRISKLHKDAAAEMINKLVGRTGLDVDLRRAGDELGFDKEKREQLKWLKAGEFFAYGPAIAMEVVRVQIGACKTTHPKAGQIAPPVPPAPAAIKELLKQLEGISQQAEDEIRELSSAKKRISELEIELKKNAISINNDSLNQKLSLLTSENNSLMEQRDALLDLLNEFKGKIEGLGVKLVVCGWDIAKGRDWTAEIAIDQPKSSEIIEKPICPPGVSRPQKNILDALAALNEVGLNPVSRIVVAFYCGVSSKTGAFANNLSRLKTTGLIDYPSSGNVSLTQMGLLLAESPGKPTNLEDFRNRVFSMLGGPQIKILQHLIDCYPDSRSRTEIANFIGVSGNTGAFANNISKLRSWGFIDYPTQGHVKAAELLFPKELV